MWWREERAALPHQHLTECSTWWRSHLLLSLPIHCQMQPWPEHKTHTRTGIIGGFTVEPPNKGHFGIGYFVLHWEVVLFSRLKMNYCYWKGVQKDVPCSEVVSQRVLYQRSHCIQWDITPRTIMERQAGACFPAHCKSSILVPCFIGPVSFDLQWSARNCEHQSHVGIRFQRRCSNIHFNNTNATENTFYSLSMVTLEHPVCTFWTCIWLWPLWYLLCLGFGGESAPSSALGSQDCWLPCMTKIEKIVHASGCQSLFNVRNKTTPTNHKEVVR